MKILCFAFEHNWYYKLLILMIPLIKGHAVQLWKNTTWALNRLQSVQPCENWNMHSRISPIILPEWACYFYLRGTSWINELRNKLANRWVYSLTDLQHFELLLLLQLSYLLFLRHWVVPSIDSKYLPPARNFTERTLVQFCTNICLKSVNVRTHSELARSAVEVHFVTRLLLMKLSQDQLI